MSHRRRLIVGVLLCLAAAGCTTRHSDAVPAGSAPSGGSATAAQELSAAVKLLATSSYRYAVSAPVSFSQTTRAEGAVDPGAGALTATASVPAARGELSVDVLALGTDVYVRFPPSFPIAGGKWVHVDGKRVPLSKFGIATAADPAGAADLTAMFVTVDRDGDRRYRGTLDLTKSPRFAGQKATAAPFQATTDDQHRLTSLTVTVTAGDKDVPLATTFSDYGTKVDATRPAGAVEAPDALYKSLGG